MMKWEVPTEAEKELVRRRGMDPEPMMVSRIGVDSLFFMDLKTRRELYIRDINQAE